MSNYSRLAQFFKNDQGEITIWQAPNAPLWLWIVTAVVSRLTSGALSQIVQFFGTLSLLAWAYLEAAMGSSPFRRVLGAIVGAALLFRQFLN